MPRAAAGPSKPVAAATALAGLEVLLYDDRYVESRDRATQPLYRSLDREGVGFRVGRLGKVSAVSRPGDGRTNSTPLYLPGDKIRWLTGPDGLPASKSAALSFLMDTDTAWLCGGAEVAAKRESLLSELSAPANAVIFSAERKMWPPYQEFHGVELKYNETHGYAPASRRQPLRYLNAGAMLGRPSDVLALHECMRERYAGFPMACPAGHGADGHFRYYEGNRSWRPPPMGPAKGAGGVSRTLKFHGMRLKGPHWGWEQACYHMYYLEGLRGELPPGCPPAALDRRGSILLHLAGMKGTELSWGSKRADGAGAPRVTFVPTGERPCVLHANGPAKYALPEIWKWWEDPRRRVRLN